MTGIDLEAFYRLTLTKFTEVNIWTEKLLAGPEVAQIAKMFRRPHKAVSHDLRREFIRAMLPPGNMMNQLDAWHTMPKPSPSTPPEPEPTRPKHRGR